MPAYKYTGTLDGRVQMFGKEDFLAPLYRKFGQRFYDYRKEWDRAAAGDGYLPRYPLFLDVEPEYKCNLKCVTCAHQYGIRQESYIKDRMSVETYRAICEESRNFNMPSITVSNNNEGLMERYLFEYIETAVSFGMMDIFLGTNAHFLDAETAERLIRSGISRLLISIDAATPETYKAVRRSDKFERVINNVKQFYDLRKKMGSELPLIRVSLVETSLNIHETAIFKEMWQAKADIISIQRYISLLPDDSARGSADTFGTRTS